MAGCGSNGSGRESSFVHPLPNTGSVNSGQGGRHNTCATSTLCNVATTGAAFPAYIADWESGSERTRGFTWYHISFNAGFAAGVALGGILVGRTSMRCVSMDEEDRAR